eukprot:46991_1
MSRLLAFITLVLCVITHAVQRKSERALLDDWVASLSTDALEHYQQYEPYRLRTASENIVIFEAELAKYKATLVGAQFAGVFTNNTVLQRDKRAAVYGLSDTANTSITLSIKDLATGQSETHTTRSMVNADWKVLLPKTYPNGGNYSLTVQCQACSKGAGSNQTIYNITFGDVYFCSGQSNMQLEMEHTFNRNYTYANITQFGKYKNIRFYTQGARYLANETFVTPFGTGGKNGAIHQWFQSYRIDMLDLSSAACWYFAQVLSDKYGQSDTQFGLLVSAVGGSIIESWIKNYTVPTHCGNQTNCPGPGCGGSYNGMVMPLVNYTIKAALWYQGENNVGRFPSGNVLNNTGYSCMEKLMFTQWRSNWSVVADTTDPMFHVGIVTLAAGTSEGKQPFMGSFRWSQSLNYDILPNPAGENMFIAQGYDIGDPWAKGCEGCGDPDAPYSAATTHFYMGPVHPRPKIYVGQRLARAANKFIYGNDAIWSGPLISGCSLSNGKLVMEFNKSMLYDEEVMVQEWDPWYNKSLAAPLHWTGLQVLVNETKWVYTDDNALKVGNDGASVTVDVTEFNGLNVTGVRYAWSDSPCCGELDKKTSPCPMNSCPIVTSKSRLPAPPIWAMIDKNGKCQCYAPQKCS